MSTPQDDHLPKPGSTEPTVHGLSTEFGDLVTDDDIESVLESSRDLLTRAGGSRDDLPERIGTFARQRLHAIGADRRPSSAEIPIVLFLCVHNAGRSQMALGWFEHLAAGRAIAWSGGSEPADAVNPSAVAAMAEVGIDIARAFPKPWTDEIVRSSDVVVTMGCGDVCPHHPGVRREDWELEDPAGRSVDAIRPIRDDIERRVRSLLSGLGVDPI